MSQTPSDQGGDAIEMGQHTQDTMEKFAYYWQHARPVASAQRANRAAVSSQHSDSSIVSFQMSMPVLPRNEPALTVPESQPDQHDTEQQQQHQQHDNVNEEDTQPLNGDASSADENDPQQSAASRAQTDLQHLANVHANVRRHDGLPTQPTQPAGGTQSVNGSQLTTEFLNEIAAGFENSAGDFGSPQNPN
eukprot:SAG31_NODE_12252_length_955_cov_1.577103_1_plen_190_part_10